MKKLQQPRMTFWWDYTAAIAAASVVIPLRLLRIAQGGTKAQKEMQRMIAEKAMAFLEGLMAAFGALFLGQGTMVAQRAFAPYRRRVHANRRRLTPR